MHEVQAISETQAHAMPCTICQSCDHVVDECPTMPAVRGMLGDQANVVGNLGLTTMHLMETPIIQAGETIQIFFGTKTTSIPTRQAQTQAPQQTSSVEQAIANLIEEIQAVITLRSGKEVDQPLPKVRQDEELLSKKTLVKERNNQEEESGKKSASKSSIEEEPRIVIKEDMMKKHMPPPFPQALHGKKEIKNSSEILEVLRQVKVNIPLLDMIKQVPTYAKFLKDLCTIKRGLHVTKNAFLTEQVSAIIQSKSPVKYKDPGCPHHCSQHWRDTCGERFTRLGGKCEFAPILCVQATGLGGLKPIAITLSLADRSVKIPRGVIEACSSSSGQILLSRGFLLCLILIPTVKEANYVPIILGRPFLATSNAIINCRNGVMQLTFGNMTLELNIFHLCKRHLHPDEDEGLEEVCLINTLVEEHCDKSLEESLNESLEVFERRVT
ncbi:hypothetical protein CK203_076127 [Vitis vinifera]|uniref:Uncharacterized protein n=1 Tax=Vitis vinifera TaxID=29760 RepID=A0A438ELY2_VITVI|nr:hypothetical protein CK203_076127 [Vitis vinifera]